MLVADQITRAARRYEGRVAAICGDEQRSFAELDERSTRLANALLGRGLAYGDRVLCLLENSVRCIEVDFALAKAGLVRVSANPRYTAREIGYILHDSEARVVIHGGEFTALIRELMPDGDRRIAVGGSEDGYGELLESGSTTLPACARDPEDLYCLMYTSGTSGRPKGVMLSHRSILAVAYNLIMEVGPIAQGEKVLLMQPMSHGAGFFVLPWFMRGGISLIMQDFDAAEAVNLAKHHAVETIKLVPTMLQRMLRVATFEAGDFPQLRQVIYGASPMPAEALREAVRRFGTKLIQVYGQSEAPVALTCLPAKDHDADHESERLASAGFPWSTVEVRILDDEDRPITDGSVGEIAVRAPQVMSGYWKLPEQTARALRNGWLRTSDMGRLDAGGCVYLVGRRDEMIITGGYNVAPREVEEVLYLHPAIAEAAVVGVPDPEWGNAIVAYAVLKEPVSETEIIEFARNHLGFKKPKRVYFMVELPKNATGKIQKSALKPSLAIERAHA